jgi:hypothetical protein
MLLSACDWRNLRIPTLSTLPLTTFRAQCYNNGTI